MNKRLMIADLDEGKIITNDSSCYFLIKRSSVKTGKNNAQYIDLELTDGLKTIGGKIWEVTEEVESIVEDGNIIKVLNAKVTRYQSNLQIILDGIKLADIADSESYRGIIPESEFSEEELLKKWNNLKDFLSADHRKVVDEFEKSGKIWELFRIIPAGKSMHHAYRKGLLEHSISVSELSLKIAEHYKGAYKLDISLIVLGSMLHDIGKIFEFQVNSTTGIVEKYSDRGRLLGHIYIGATFLEKVINKSGIENTEFKMEFLHIILSHHGEYEFGSPKKPKTMESLIVSMADNMDANLNAVHIGFNNEMDENWTKTIYSLQRPFFRSKGEDA